MNKEELIKLGDEAIRSALDNTYVIIDQNGNILTKTGDDDDTMMFDDRLGCEKNHSVILFDDENGARGAIEEILKPQENGVEYSVVKVISDEDEDEDEDENPEFDIVSDDTDDFGLGWDAIDAMDDDDDDFFDIEYDLEDITVENIDSEIEEAIQDGDDELVSMLNILKMIKLSEEDDDDDSEDEDDIDESFHEIPSLNDIRRILKRNGYQLVSQKGGKQAWSKSSFDEPIYIPIGDGADVESIDWDEIVRTRKLDVGV